MSARSGWTTPDRRRRRFLAQFVEIRIRSRRRLGALALNRIQGDQRPVGPLRLGRRYSRDALHRVCAQRWNGGFRRSCARLTVRSASNRHGTILLMSHEIWKSRKSQRAISRAARTELTSPPSPPPRRPRGGRARRQGGRGIRRCRGCRCSCRRPGWSCRRAISARTASSAPPRRP